jgi:hypothetical protein
MKKLLLTVILGLTLTFFTQSTPAFSSEEPTQVVVKPGYEEKRDGMTVLDLLARTETAFRRLDKYELTSVDNLFVSYLFDGKQHPDLPWEKESTRVYAYVENQPFVLYMDLKDTTVPGDVSKDQEMRLVDGVMHYQEAGDEWAYTDDPAEVNEEGWKAEMSFMGSLLNDRAYYLHVADVWGFNEDVHIHGNDY